MALRAGTRRAVRSAEPEPDAAAAAAATATATCAVVIKVGRPRAASGACLPGARGVCAQRLPAAAPWAGCRARRAAGDPAGRRGTRLPSPPRDLTKHRSSPGLSFLTGIAGARVAPCAPRR